MATSKIIKVQIDNEILESLEELISKAGSNENTTLLAIKVTRLLISLKAEFDGGIINDDPKIPKKKITQKKEIETLNYIIERLKWRISGLMVNNMMSNQLSKVAGANMTAAAADIIFNPAAVNISCTVERKMEDFPIKVRDIYAIVGEGNLKRILLKQPIKLHRGKMLYFIEPNMSFDDLLWTLQKGEKIIMRVHKSFALNLFEYTYSNKDGFELIDSPTDNIFDEIRKVKTDSEFEKLLYRKQIIRMNEYHSLAKKVYDNTRKMEKILEYMKSLDSADNLQ